MSSYTRWIWVLGLGPLCVLACSSSGAPADAGVGPDSSSSGSSSSGSSGGGSSSGSSSGASGSSSSSGGEVDAGITILFPFDTATSSTDVAAWPGDTFCIGQTGVGPTSDASTDAVSDASGEAAANPCGIYNYLQGISTATYDPNVGDPGMAGDPGSLEFTVPFSQFNSQADFQHVFSVPIDLSNKTLFVRVERDPGYNTNDLTYPEAFVLAVKTGLTYAYGASLYTNFTAPAGSFQEFDLPLSMTPTGAATGFDPTQVVAIELHFDTGAGPASGVAADAASLLPTATTFHVDTIGYF